MHVLARSWTVAAGDRPRVYRIEFLQGQRRVTVVCEGRRRTLEWSGPARWKPGSREHLELAIAAFDRLELVAGVGLKRSIGIPGRQPGMLRLVSETCDRQLPVADRA